MAIFAEEERKKNLFSTSEKQIWEGGGTVSPCTASQQVAGSGKRERKMCKTFSQMYIALDCTGHIGWKDGKIQGYENMGINISKIGPFMQ